MLYLARRHLGYEPEEWWVLPWWKTRLYTEGLLWEFAGKEPDSDAGIDGLAALGLTVNRQEVSE